jgi:hypothetical protein
MMQDLNSFRLEKDLMMGQLGLLAEITHFDKLWSSGLDVLTMRALECILIEKKRFLWCLTFLM